jgi:hypothetical protein
MADNSKVYKLNIRGFYVPCVYHKRKNWIPLCIAKALIGFRNKVGVPDLGVIEHIRASELKAIGLIPDKVCESMTRFVELNKSLKVIAAKREHGPIDRVEAIISDAMCGPLIEFAKNKPELRLTGNSPKKATSRENVGKKRKRSEVDETSEDEKSGENQEYYSASESFNDDEKNESVESDEFDNSNEEHDAKSELKSKDNKDTSSPPPKRQKTDVIESVKSQHNELLQKYEKLREYVKITEETAKMAAKLAEIKKELEL